MVTQAAQLMETAAEHLNAGRLPEATQAYLNAVRAAPGEDQAWLGLGLSVVLQRQYPMVQTLADQRQQLRGDGFAFFHDLTLTIMTYGLHAHMLGLHSTLPPDSPYQASALYSVLCCHILADREDQAFALLPKLKELLAAQRDLLPIASTDRFNVAYRQTTLVEDGTYMDGLDDTALAAIAAKRPPLERIGQWQNGNGAPALLTACDGQYLERFGRAYLESARHFAPDHRVHLHVIEPTQAGLDAVTGLGANLSVEAASTVRSGAYFACNRFLVAPEIMDHVAAPLIITDVDILLSRPMDDLCAAARDFDFASFTHDGPGPCSRLPAVLTWFAPTPSGQAALDILNSFILSKLETPWPLNWMLDQAGLMTMRRRLRAKHLDARVGTLNQSMGGNFRTCLTLCGDADEKASLIRAAGTNNPP